MKEIEEQLNISSHYERWFYLSKVSSIVFLNLIRAATPKPKFKQDPAQVGQRALKTGSEIIDNILGHKCLKFLLKGRAKSNIKEFKARICL